MLLDLSHTAHPGARAGVQRVALELRKALRRLSQTVHEITYDPHADTWRVLHKWEYTTLDVPPKASRKRGTSWPLSAQLRGWWQRRRHSVSRAINLPNSSPDGLIFPDNFKNSQE